METQVKTMEFKLHRTGVKQDLVEFPRSVMGSHSVMGSWAGVSMEGG